VEAPTGAPQVVAGLTAGVYKYKANIKVGENPVEMSLTTAIQEGPDVWTIAETTTLPTGESSDTSTLDKKNLTLLTRTIKQGPVSIDLAFKENRVKGKMNIGGQEKPFDIEVGGPLLGDGAGAMFVLGALPLTEGYSVTLRSFDVQTQKVKLSQVKVAGSESVTVPAGSFETYRMEIVPEDSGSGSYTVWITKDTRKPVKIIATLPQLGGAKLTAELQ
jgi:hypothetical protein